MIKEEAIDLILGIKSNTKWKTVDWGVGVFPNSTEKTHNIIFYNGVDYTLCSFPLYSKIWERDVVSREYMESVKFTFYKLGEMKQVITKTSLFMHYESSELSKYLNPFASVFEHVQYGEHKESNDLHQLVQNA